MINGFLKGKVALVTGASRNLGRACAVMLANQGADVAVHYSGEKSSADAEETATAVRAAGSSAELIPAELTDTAQLRALFERIIERFGRFDVLVNNAGMIIKKEFAEIDDKEFDRIFAVNAKAPFLCMREAARRMSDGGRVINIGTSLLGATTGHYSVYAGSKAPLEHFTRALAKEQGPRGITVNTIAPGALETPFFHAAETPESVAFVKQWTGGLGDVNDVVPLIEFLVSPGARWVTAQTIFINGGVLAR